MPTNTAGPKTRPQVKGASLCRHGPRECRRCLKSGVLWTVSFVDPSTRWKTARLPADDQRTSELPADSAWLERRPAALERREWLLTALSRRDRQYLLIAQVVEAARFQRLRHAIANKRHPATVLPFTPLAATVPRRPVTVRSYDLTSATSLKLLIQDVQLLTDPSSPEDYTQDTYAQLLELHLYYDPLPDGST